MEKYLKLKRQGIIRPLFHPILSLYLSMAELIIGGARSGKSAHAEKLALHSGLKVIYLATAQAGDDEMARRVAHHQERRPLEWGTIEEPLHLAAVLQREASSDTCILVDCLTLWLTNLVFSGSAAARMEAGLSPDCPQLQAEIESLLQVLPTLPGRVIMVSNELGWGVVPIEALSRTFVDEQGRLNQRVAEVCERVTLVAAGLPLVLKGAPA